MGVVRKNGLETLKIHSWLAAKGQGRLSAGTIQKELGRSKIHSEKS